MIRKMNELDLNQVLEIEHYSFGDNWDKNQFTYEIKLNHYSSMYVYEIDGEIVAYSGLWVTFELGQIVTLAVKNGKKNKGYAKELMNHMIKECEDALCDNIQLEVRESNYVARNLYGKLGFFDINIRKGYYGDNHEDAIIMCKPLGGNLV